LSLFNLNSRWAFFYAAISLLPILLNIILPEGQALFKLEEDYSGYGWSTVIQVILHGVFLVFLLWQIINAFRQTILTWKEMSEMLHEKTVMLEKQSQEVIGLNEELQAQAEELQTQSEELQAQAENLHQLNEQLIQEEEQEKQARQLAEAAREEADRAN